ncbi:PREDICTED: putative disease resistance [Prunus dulcis]|uniref:PREDICTED: putative disease resistance n=1 Tax=Prunus dulcis TaxID=3755 RepID=A0A5E4FPY7_PRUDU|nr:PREDICTED: putative disease resistance [Prunus dulcis]
MVPEVVAGAFLSSFLSVLFHRMSSRQVLDFIRGRKKTNKLLGMLKIKLRSVNALLDDAEEKQIRNTAVGEWLDELKDAVYEVDDLLDEINIKALRCNLEAKSGSSSTSKITILNSTSFDEIENAIGPRIGEILDRLELILKERVVLCIKTSVKGRQQATLPTTSLVEDNSVYGRDKDKDTIIELLLSNDGENKKISIIPIVGMGGIGKTTLAQLVYKDLRVKQHFDLQVWVCVSEEFDVVRITQIIYGAVSSQTCDMTDLNLLQVKLQEALTGKKFLFVCDDVWNENYIQWDLLRRPFESGAHGSKIIVTTRNEGVASIMGTLPTHHLMEISDDNCWLLFAKHAFKIEGLNENSKLEVIGREIVKKCKGLPLAAKALGGLLRSKANEDEWKNILKSDIWELLDKDVNILPALWLSYHYLPPHLKRCFAYCSLFPKDHNFKKSKLVMLWMAEDLLQPRKKKMAEEVGEEYFDDLVSRSFFQQSSSVQSFFTMHDLINDLAKFVSGKFCVRLEDSDSLNTAIKTRHLSFMKKTDCHAYEKFDDLKYLHTFLPLSLLPIWAGKFRMLDLHHLLHTLQYVRVLNLSRYDIRELPDSISNLIHLRYLDMSYTLIQKLPDSVCILYNLQTLLLSWCLALAELPTDLGKLINLRHLDIRGTKLEKMPPKMGELKDLQTLSDFVLDKDHGDDITELKEFQHLHGTLRIAGLQNIVHAEDALKSNMREKEHLNELILQWGCNSNDSEKDRQVLNNLQPHTNLKELTICSYGSTSFSRWLVHCSSNLVCLRLKRCENILLLPPLGQLPLLKELEIDGLNGVVSIDNEFYADDTCAIKPSFQCLQMLKIKNMLEWEKWSYEGGGFPNLRELRLLKCPKLTGILTLDYFPRLNMLKLCGAGLESVTNISQELILTDLTEIYIDECKKLRSLPEQMQALLPSLQSMSIENCPEMHSFFEGGLPSKLKSVSIRSCKKLIANRVQWSLPRLTSLRHLTVSFEECEAVDSFPEEGLLPFSLTSLWISSLLNLRTIEGELTHLTSLQELTIQMCPELQCLPDEGLQTSLSHLQISECPLLKQRCQRETGEDWPKIAHINNIEIDGKQI